jgi:Cu(I)/Ag(I) efflux system membrane fusion protein
MKIRILMLIVIMTGVFTLTAEMQEFDVVMQKISDIYLKIHHNLASDLSAGNLQIALEFKPLIDQLKEAKIPAEHVDHYRDVPLKLDMAIDKFISAKDISAQREAFRDLSKPMAMWASMAVPEGINVVYCSMAPGSWLQKGEEIRNPYYGTEMLKCGEIVSSPNKENMHHMHKK